MAALTQEQRDEVNELIGQRTVGFGSLSKEQRAEVDALTELKLKSTGLSFGQKWEAGVIIATLLGGALAIFGTAGLYFIKSTVETVARSTTVETRQEQVASLLNSDNGFIKKVAGSITTLPQGGVVAFDLPEGCPPGWTSYANAMGRSIIGAGEGGGLTKRAYQEQGGNESHKLTIDELPPHNFRVNVNLAQLSTVDRYDAGGKDYWVVTVSPGPIDTDSIGSGIPFATMPPFVVLYYCKKD